jgi:hypothetical protein
MGAERAPTETGGRPDGLDPAVWHRAGRGMEKQFYATDEELTSIVESAVSAEGMPYRVIAAETVKRGASYERHVLSCTVDQVVRCCSRGGGHLAFLFSEAATSVESWTGESLSDRAAINGLVMVQHGFRYEDGGRDASRFAITNRVRNVLTGETRETKDYLPLFLRLKRAIEKELVWSTIRPLADGTDDDEDLTLALMTDGAAEAARREPGAWVVRPGRRVGPRG